MEALRKRVLKSNIFQVLAIKPFLLMMLSEIFSQLAFNMQHFVLIFIIYGTTRSNTAVSGMILSFMVPAVLFSVVSGILVDRWNKKKVLLSTHLIRGALLLPFLIPNLHLGLIYMFTFLIAIATQLFIPAESSIIPQLVPRNLIVSANAVFSFGLFGVMLAGYVFSGPALLMLGRTYTIILLISLFLLGALVVASIKITDKRKEVSGNTLVQRFNYSFVKEVKEIFAFVKKTRNVIHALFMITIAQAVIYMFAVLAPGYVATILEAPLESLSLILVAPACVGLGLGALIFGSIGKKIKHELISAVGFLIVGGVFVSLPFTSRVASYGFVRGINSFLPGIIDINILHIIILIAFILGFGMSLVFVPSNSTIQIETDEQIRGRMYGLLNTLIGAVSFLPVILAGGLADILGIGAVIAGVGILMAIIGGYYLLTIKFRPNQV